MGKKATDWDPDDWLEATEAAKILGRARPAINRYMKAGVLATCRKYGRLFVSRADVESFVPPGIGKPILSKSP